MRLHTFENEFLVVPNIGESGPGLRIDRRTGLLSRYNINEKPLEAGADAQVIFGIMGFAKLLRGKYLVVITNAQVVARINGHEIRRVTETDIIPFSAAKLHDDLPSAQHQTDEAEYLRMLGYVLESHYFYFSYTYDVTHSAQRIAAISNSDDATSPLWKRADERFFWNRYLSSDLIEGGFDEFVLPVITGFVGAHQTSLNNRNFTFVIFTRRGCKRAGRRFTSRGVDLQGNASNYAETEQLIVVPTTTGNRQSLYSFLQTRGSIPIVWKQTVSLKYMPKPEMGDAPKSSLAFRHHFDEQVKKYGKQILINLIDQKGKELLLERAYADEVLNSQDKRLRYVAFDFHRECRKMKYENLSKLENELAAEMNDMGYFAADITESQSWEIRRFQSSILRTNCMDCLDRTNVVQSVFAHSVLIRQFQELGILSTDVRALNSPTFEQIFKNTWADNADAVAIQYTGTGALKTDYTRTGKRSHLGAVLDLTNSAKRYILNNFYDGDTQDALDVFLGVYVPQKDQPTPFEKPVVGKDAPSLLRLLMMIFLVLLAVFIMWGLVGPWFGIPTPSYHIRQILFLLAYPVVAFKVAEKNGRKYVNKPHFREVEQQWFSHPAKSSKQD